MHGKTLLTCYCNASSTLWTVIFTWVASWLQAASDHKKRIVAFTKIPTHSLAGGPTYSPNLSICGQYEAVLHFASAIRIDSPVVDRVSTSSLIHARVNMLPSESPPVLGFSRQCGAQHQQQNQSEHTDLHDEVSKRGLKSHSREDQKIRR